MRIWIIDHYSVPVRYYPLARNTIFAKKLMEYGHDVTIFAASTVHNSDINLVEDGKKYAEIIDDGVKYVLIRCKQYTGNGIKRIMNMYEFAYKLESVCDLYSRPDAIISTSMTLQACRAGIKLGKKYQCKTVAQVTDLWPESIVAYGLAKRSNPLVVCFRRIEKWIYLNADRIIFSMEGAYDYIIERNWEKDIPRQKVALINNGVDLKQFDFNRENFQIKDDDLENEDLYKVVYVGSVRKANNLSILLDAAKMIEDKKISLLVWGDGDDLEYLKKRVIDENIDNVRFKGRVEKRYIPYIISKADLNLMHVQSSPILRFGISPNKLFDYLAAGKPILVDFDCPYNPAIDCGAAVKAKDYSAKEIADSIKKAVFMDAEIKNRMRENARHGSEMYDFNKLTKRLIGVIESI